MCYGLTLCHLELCILYNDAAFQKYNCHSRRRHHVVINETENAAMLYHLAMSWFKEIGALKKLEQLLNKHNLLGNVLFLKLCIHKVNIFSFVSFRFLFGILHCSYVQPMQAYNKMLALEILPIDFSNSLSWKKK